MNIRESTSQDIDSLWQIIQPIAQAQQTYGLDPKLSKEHAIELWLNKPMKSFVVEENNKILGTYYLKANHEGPGAHVANCGYMVSELARGKGIARLMCEHSKQQALSLGFLAMQFNFVAESNHVAVSLWQKLGFEIVGRLPRAFKHPTLGLVDALVMYQWLNDEIQ